MPTNDLPHHGTFTCTTLLNAGNGPAAKLVQLKQASTQERLAFRFFHSSTQRLLPNSADMGRARRLLLEHNLHANLARNETETATVNGPTPVPGLSGSSTLARGRAHPGLQHPDSSNTGPFRSTLRGNPGRVKLPSQIPGSQSLASTASAAYCKQ